MTALGQRQPTYTIRDEFFETITPESSYILGLLYTDGWIIHSRERSVFCLASKDRELIDKCLELMGSNHRVMETSGGKYHRFQIGSRKMVADLMALGIVPRKTWAFHVPYIPDQHLSEYTLGVLDGDGCVFVRDRNGTSAELSVIVSNANRSFLEVLGRKLKDQIGIIPIVKSMAANCYSLTYNGKQALVLYQFLYRSDGPISGLSRKRNKFREFISLDKTNSRRKCRECKCGFYGVGPYKYCPDCRDDTRKI